MVERLYPLDLFNSVSLKAKYVKRDKDFYGPGKHRYWYTDPKSGKVVAAKEEPKKIITKPAELINKLNSDINPAHKARFKKNALLYKAGKDTAGKHSKDGVYSAERSKLHKSIAKKYTKHTAIATPKGKPEVVFMAGSPGSGKTYATKDMFEKASGDGTLMRHKTTGEHFIVLNADDIKGHLPENSGGLDAMLVHNESSQVNTALVEHFRSKGVNVIMDGTLAKKDKAAREVDAFNGKGYKSTLLHVDVPVHQAMYMAHARYKEEKRFVPYELINDYDSKIKNSVSSLKGKFSSSKVINNTMPDDILMRNVI